MKVVTEALVQDDESLPVCPIKALHARAGCLAGEGVSSLVLVLLKSCTQLQVCVCVFMNYLKRMRAA